MKLGDGICFDWSSLMPAFLPVGGMEGRSKAYEVSLAEAVNAKFAIQTEIYVTRVI